MRARSFLHSVQFKWAGLQLGHLLELSLFQHKISLDERGKGPCYPQKGRCGLSFFRVAKLIDKTPKHGVSST